MSILGVLIILIIIGFVLWLINTYIPMDNKIKTILNVVIVIFIILWLANVFGLIGGETLRLR